MSLKEQKCDIKTRGKRAITEDRQIPRRKYENILYRPAKRSKSLIANAKTILEMKISNVSVRRETTEQFNSRTDSLRLASCTRILNWFEEYLYNQNGRRQTKAHIEAGPSYRRHTPENFEWPPDRLNPSQTL